MKRGAVYAGVAGVQLTIKLHTLLGWHGARLFIYGFDTHGGAPSDLVGDIQGVSNLQAPPALRIEEAWLQQNLVSNRLSFLVGQYDVNSEFYRLQSAGLFVNSAFGIGPEFAQSGVEGPSTFPYTSLGARVEYKPSLGSVVRVAVMDGVPIHRSNGGTQAFASGDGALIVGEVGLISRPDTAIVLPRERRFMIGRGLTRPYSGKIVVGGWYYTSSFPDLVDTSSTGAPVSHTGSGGVYLIVDETIWSQGHGSHRVLTAFTQLGLGDHRVNQIASYLGGGFTLVAPFAGRSQDEVGLAVAAARTGSHYERAQESDGIPVTGGETTLEVTYLAQLASWVAVQPDLQYVIHPGASGSIANAFVAGLRVALAH